MNPRKTLAGLVALAAAALSLTFAGSASAATLPTSCAPADYAADAPLQSALATLNKDVASYTGGAASFGPSAVLTGGQLAAATTSLAVAQALPSTSGSTTQAGIVASDVAATQSQLNILFANGCVTPAPAPTTAAPTSAPVPAPAAEVPESSVASNGTPACITAVGSVSARWAAYDVAFRSSNVAVARDYIAYQRALNEAQATCVHPIVVSPVASAPVVPSGTTTSVTTATIPSSTTGVQTGDGSAPSE